jgi:hypothetical protein
VEDQELRELQDPSNWEPEEGDGLRHPTRPPRAVVSVAFTRDDFRAVTEHAKAHGMKTSEFIRKAALAFTDPGRERARVRIHSATGFQTDYPTNSSRGAESRAVFDDAPALTSS